MLRPYFCITPQVDAWMIRLQPSAASYTEAAYSVAEHIFYIGRPVEDISLRTALPYEADSQKSFRWVVENSPKFLLALGTRKFCDKNRLFIPCTSSSHVP